MRPDDAQVTKAFDEAPELIQRALTDGIAIAFMARLPSRYDIHIDTAGYVTEFIRNMLLGFIRPEEFMGKLHSVGINDQTARQITTDLNTEVFIPLRDEIRKGDGSPVAPRSIPRVSVPNVTPIKPVEPKKEPEPPSINLIKQIDASKSQVTASVPKEVPVSAPVPTMRTMQHDIELVQHGSIPAPYPVEIPQLHPAQATPARSFQTASVPVTVPPVQPHPVPEIVHIVPDATRHPTPSTAQAAPAKEYTSDPYREAI